MSANVLLVLYRCSVSLLVSMHTDAIQLGCQWSDALHHLQIIIKNETAVLQDQDLEQGLDGCIADIGSLSITAGIHWYIIHASGHNRGNDLLTHLANNFRTFSRCGFYTSCVLCLPTSRSDESQIGQLPIETDSTQRNIHIKRLTCVRSN